MFLKRLGWVGVEGLIGVGLIRVGQGDIKVGYDYVRLVWECARVQQSGLMLHN